MQLRICAILPEQQGQEKKQFFFEKKNQKTFAHRLRARRDALGGTGVWGAGKSFLVLFFKKELLPSLAAEYFE
jgi:hypothetical protein